MWSKSLRWSLRSYIVLNALPLVSTAALALTATDAIKDADSFACVGTTIGQSNAASNKEFKAFSLCIMRVNCEAKEAVAAEGILKGAKMHWWVPCKPVDNACPDMKACVAASVAPGRDFGVMNATTEPSDDEERKQVCSYASSFSGTDVVLSLARKANDKVDRVCLAGVSCRPELNEPAAVCLPKKVSTEAARDGKTTTTVVCPSASSCVAGRFPLTTPKVDVAAKPHGGAPAQTVSNGSTHVQGEKR